MMRSPALRAVVTNGSMRNAASTSPFDSAAPISGKSTSRSSTCDGFTPAFSSDALTTTSAMLFSVFTATLLPARSSTSRMSLPLRTISAPKSFCPAPCADVPGATAWIGRPFDAAISSETTFEPATWILPLTSDGTAVAPPCDGWSLIFRFCLSKKPFSIPNATNADGTPAVSWTASVVGPLDSPLVDAPPPPPPSSPPHAAATSATSASAPSARVRLIVFMALSSSSLASRQARVDPSAPI
jgi:hypothetical protein